MDVTKPFKFKGFGAMGLTKRPDPCRIDHTSRDRYNEATEIARMLRCGRLLNLVLGTCLGGSKRAPSCGERWAGCFARSFFMGLPNPEAVDWTLVSKPKIEKGGQSTTTKS